MIVQVLSKQHLNNPLLTDSMLRDSTVMLTYLYMVKIRVAFSRREIFTGRLSITLESILIASHYHRVYSYLSEVEAI
jgi:hypothetical protein